MDQSILFYRFMIGLFVVLILYGVGMIFVVSTVSESIGLRMVSAFGTMFAGVIGLGSGYLLGKQTNGK